MNNQNNPIIPHVFSQLVSFYRQRIKVALCRCAVLFLTLLLTACGGGGSTAEPPAPDSQLPTNPVPTEPDKPTPQPTTSAVIVPFEFEQQALGKTYNGAQLQSATFTNVSGAFRLPLAQQSLTGNLTISIDIEDPDGLKKVYVGFNGDNEALQLCNNNCPSPYHVTKTGFNPLDFGISDDSQRLELWAIDKLNNKTLVNTVAFFWQATPITGFSAPRTSNNIAMRWDGLNNYLRYNVYFASRAGVTHKNYQDLPDGEARLALKTPNYDLSGKDNSKIFFATVTGIDGSGESAFSSVHKIAAMNGITDNIPVAVNDSFLMDEDTSLSANITTNDSDLESTTLTINPTPVIFPTNGQLTINADGTFIYLPSKDFNGNDGFQYQISDSLGQTATASVTITVNPVNDAPESLPNNFNALDGQNAVPIDLNTTAFATNQQGVLTVAAPGVLINDLDIDSTNLTAVLITQATQGIVELSANGGFTYTADPSATGTDQFSYQANDASGAAAPVTTVVISINNASFPPVAANDEYVLSKDQTLAVDNSATNRMSVLNNDTDLDSGDTLTVDTSLIKATSHGTLNMAADGTFTYIPNMGFFGVDSFSYRITDSQGNTAQASGKLTVNKTNSAPTAGADSYEFNEDTILDVAAIDGLLANDNDLDFDPITLDTTALQNTSNGALTLATDGSFSYVPNANFFGSDSFSYRIFDGKGGSAQATVTLAINSINDAPIANDDTIQTIIDNAIEINVLANDTDAENQALTVTAVTLLDAATGAISALNNNLFTYTPTTGFEGTAQIDYTISDTDGAVGSAKVIISVTPNNSAPVGVDDSYTLNEDELLSVNGINHPLLIANDTDVNNDVLSVNVTPISPTSNGTLVLAAAGTFDYQPNSNFFGQDSFTYEVFDGQGAAGTATVTLTVLSVNDNPVANNDTVATSEETLINIKVLSNDNDIENDTLSIASASAQNGTVTIETNNTLNYTPNLNFVGTDELSYSITDGNQGSASALVTITVQNINDAPTAVDDTATAVEDQPVTINVLANDSDIDDDALSVLSASANNGVVSINPDSTLLYTPNLNFNGTDTISYTASDGNGGTAIASVNVTVSATNDAPIANNDSAQTDEDIAVTINVLANDTDLDGDTLTVTLATATNGTVTINLDSSLNYLPNANFNGTDSLDYTIDDGHNSTASAKVEITITSINDAPVAVTDSATTNEDSSVNINVLANDTDVDTDQSILKVTSATATNGTVSIGSNQSLAYQPNANFNGSDIINYVLDDNNGGTAFGTVALTVVPVNDAPVAVNDAASTSEDTVVNINVLSNDTDIDSVSLSLVSANANNGTVILIANNTLEYQPKENFNGTDTINYTISDNDGGNASSTVLVSVGAVNDPPIAVNDTATMDEDSTINIAVLNNDVDIDGDSLTVLSATANNGTIIVNADNTVAYTPTANFNGSDTISYNISDNNGGNASATVLVTVNKVNDLPIAINDSATTNEDTSVAINVLGNDSDIDNDSLSISAATANNGNVSINNDQSLQYTPNANFFGADIIDYTVNDGQGGSASATVSVAVAGVNDSPTAVSDNVVMQEDSTIALDPLANDFDVDGDAIEITGANSNNGTVAMVSGQSLIYAPNPNYFGLDIITYSISDNNGGSDFAFINIEITPVNDMPVVANETANTDEDVPVTVNVLTNDFDADGDSLSITSANASSGNVTINTSNLTYTPNANFHGTDSVIYVVSDGAGASATGTLTVVVNNLNDIPVANADSAALDEDTSTIIAPLSNDTDADGDTLTITSATLVSAADSGGPSGTLTLNTDKTLTYVPRLNFNGVDTVNYTIEDGNGASNASTVTITVRSVNDFPIANTDTSTTTEDTPIIIAVLGNDTDIDGDALIVKTATASNGTVAITVDNTLNYTPNSNYNGTDTINYQIDDGHTGLSSSTVTVTITPVNDLPIAGADTASVAEDSSVIISVLTNDSDPEDDPLTVTAATATHGSPSVKSDFTISYIPNANFHGTDTISYTLNDGNAGSSTGIVTVTVTSVNDNPVALNDTISGNEDARIIVDVLSNDSDIDGDALTVTAATTTNGTVSVRSDQRLEQLTNIDFNGTVTISYTISDGQGGSASASAVVTVTPVNDDPKPIADTATTSTNTLVNIAVLTNDADPDGDTLTISAASASNGSTAISSTGTSIDYTPNNNFSGSDTINYTVDDGNGGTASSTVAVTVTAAPNNNPVANPDTATAEEDTPLNINVLLNDTDADSDLLSVTTATASNGAVTIKSDQTLDYVPNVNFNGADTINYDISDGRSGTASSTVALSVTPANDAPTINDQTGSIAENSANGAAVMTMTGSDIDSGDSLSYSISAGNTDSVFAINTTSGAITVVNNSFLNFESTSQYLLTVKVTDDGTPTMNQSATATIDVTNVTESTTPTLDTGFGSSGTAGSNSFASRSADQPRAALLQSGKLIVAGSSGTTNKVLTLTRFNTDGTVDRTFGTQGVVNTDFFNDTSWSEEAVAVAIDSSGKIVVAGNHFFSTTYYTFTARYSADGLLDTTFNSQGFHVNSEAGVVVASDMKIDALGNILLSGTDGSDFKIVKFSGDGFSHVDLSVDFAGGIDAATSIVVQSDGKAVLTGSAINGAFGSDFATARFEISPTFQLDTTYGNAGKVLVDMGTSTNDIGWDSLITSTDEVIVAGSTVNASTQKDMAMMKINSTGILVSSFAGGGKLVVDIDNDAGAGTNTSTAKKIATDSTGNLYFGVNKGITGFNAIIFKTDSLGSPINSFGTTSTGTVELDVNNSPNDAEALVVDSSNRPMLVTKTTQFINADVAVARYTAAGILDTSFGGAGLNSIDPTFSTDVLNEMVELNTSPNAGKFVAVGSSGNNLIVARYLATGVLDETFGKNGYYTLMGLSAVFEGRDIIELSDGRLVIVGREDNKGLVVMLDNTGTPDTTFGTAGIKTHTGATSLVFNAVIVDSNGKIVVGGTNTNGSNKDLFFARMDLTGNPDAPFSSDGTVNIDLTANDDVLDIVELTGGAFIAVGKHDNNGLIVKILNNGTMDTATFGTGNGFMSIDLDPAASVNVDTLRRVKIKADGRIVAAGYTTNSQPLNTLVQVNSNGTLDTSFDTDGIVSHNYGSGGSKILGLALDSSENILVTGFNSNGSNDDIFIARVTPTGAIDTLFNGSTGAILVNYGATEMATAIQVRADGSVVIAGADNLNLFPTDFFFVQKYKLVEP